MNRDLTSKLLRTALFIEAQGVCEQCGKEINKDLYFDHNLEIINAENNVNPARGTAGYLTTYQAVVRNPMLHDHELER